MARTDRQRTISGHTASVGPGFRQNDAYWMGSHIRKTVIPAQAGIQTRGPRRAEPHRRRLWIPACAGMTNMV